MKKNKNTIMLVLAFLTIAFYISGCKDRELRTDYIDQRLKDYCLFQEGSYWVYESDNGDIDSIYLYQREGHIVEDDNRNYESIDLQFTSSHYPYDIFGMAAAPFVGGGGHLGEIWSSAIFTPMGGFFVGGVDTVNRTITALAGTEETYIAYYESLLVEDRTYKKVRQYDFNMRNLLSRQTIYWAKGIGRVKYIDGDSTVWNLIKYNIKQ